jgi:hypothetical protein
MKVDMYSGRYIKILNALLSNGRCFIYEEIINAYDLL